MKTVILKCEHAITGLDRDCVRSVPDLLHTDPVTHSINSRSIGTWLELEKDNMSDGHCG